VRVVCSYSVRRRCVIAETDEQECECRRRARVMTKRSLDFTTYSTSRSPLYTGPTQLMTSMYIAAAAAAAASRARRDGTAYRSAAVWKQAIYCSAVGRSVALPAAQPLTLSGRHCTTPVHLPAAAWLARRRRRSLARPVFADEMRRDRT